MSTVLDTSDAPVAVEQDTRIGVPMALPGATSAPVPARAARRAHYEFRPFNVGRWIVWGSFALLLVIAPLVFTSSLSQTILSQMGVAIIVCLSYNMLLGQGGMLSFGHAVYSGMGAFLA